MKSFGHHTEQKDLKLECCSAATLPRLQALCCRVREPFGQRWRYKVWRWWDFACGDAVVCSAAAARLLLKPPNTLPPAPTPAATPPPHCRSSLSLHPRSIPLHSPLSHSLICVCKCVWSLLVPLQTHTLIIYIFPRPFRMNPQPIMFTQSAQPELSAFNLERGYPFVWFFSLLEKKKRLNRCCKWRFLHMSRRYGEGWFSDISNSCTHTVKWDRCFPPGMYPC